MEKILALIRKYLSTFMFLLLHQMLDQVEHKLLKYDPTEQQC